MGAVFLILRIITGLGGIGSLIYWYYKATALTEVQDIYYKIKDAVGHKYAEIAKQNPFVDTFLVVGVVTFISTVFIAAAHTFFKVRMGRAVRSFLQLSPFIVVASGTMYYAYIDYLRKSDKTFHMFRGAKSIDDMITIKAKNKFTHKEKLKEDKEYVFNAIGRKMSKAFYEDMFQEIGTPECLTQRMKVTADLFEKKNSKWPMTPLMYAAYTGSAEAATALLSKTDNPVRDIDRQIEVSDTGGFTGRNMEVTAYDIAIETKHNNIATLIKEVAEKNGIKAREINGVKKHKDLAELKLHIINKAKL